MKFNFIYNLPENNNVLYGTLESHILGLELERERRHKELIEAIENNKNKEE